MLDSSQLEKKQHYEQGFVETKICKKHNVLDKVIFYYSWNKGLK